ncbi:glycoside hydrolase family 55 protein [Cohnella mopanensis]|uniref:glycoside hydrolase family 55 protein n=1 Tax=Cohnella mopanensis TaxID=2911966 RepID=UPI001EF99F70|nr:glycoside hydrolase family 55 protein [Cohnella mopanensis]
MIDDPSVISVKDLGAKGDGVTDDSQAFIKAIQTAESKARKNLAPSSDSNQLGTITIYIPSGSYLIKSPEAIIRGTYKIRTVGLQIQGAGAGNTQILFQPVIAGSYLMRNNDAWLYLNIDGITFDSNNTKNNFMDSYSNGGAQKYSLSRCQFTGSWNYGIYLEGNNTNSEFSYYSCTWTGSHKIALYVSAATGSDQSVNYNFYACNFEVSDGTFVRFEKGGNINIWGGSYIHYGTNAGTFFQLLGTTHGYGTERFLCIGARIEHRNELSKLIECEWSGGTISFINVDMSSSMHLRPPTAVAAVFRSVNTQMPILKFDNCRLIGSHQYNYTINSWSQRHNVQYENCTFEQHDDPSTFITIAPSDANANKGGAPVINFNNCRGASSSANTRNIWDCNYGFATSTLGLTSKKIASVKTPEGKFPYVSIPTIDFYMPLNAIVTNVTLYWPAAVATSQNKTWTFTLRTSELTPTVLAKVSGDGTKALANGFNVSVPQLFACNNATNRHLVFECNTAVNQSIDGCLCLVEYIG